MVKLGSCLQKSEGCCSRGEVDVYFTGILCGLLYVVAMQMIFVM